MYISFIWIATLPRDAKKRLTRFSSARHNLRHYLSNYPVRYNKRNSSRNTQSCALTIVLLGIVFALDSHAIQLDFCRDASHFHRIETESARKARGAGGWIPVLQKVETIDSALGIARMNASAQQSPTRDKKRFRNTFAITGFKSIKQISCLCDVSFFFRKDILSTIDYNF